MCVRAHENLTASSPESAPVVGRVYILASLYDPEDMVAAREMITNVTAFRCAKPPLDVRKLLYEPGDGDLEAATARQVGKAEKERGSGTVTDDKWTSTHGSPKIPKRPENDLKTT